METIEDIYKCLEKIIKTLNQQGISKHQAEDTAYEAVEKYLRKEKKETTNLCGYLYRTAINIWRDYSADQKRRRKCSLSLPS